ncbi:MAG: phosphatidylserine decarboxylase [Bdellovibrionaceae bacterium]|nr:phosphatidylserine decarboxylase [Pseudobdellovibrionaceae bacterium]
MAAVEFLYLVPKNALSRFVGWLVHLKLPGGLASFTITQFAKAYNINLEEAERPVSAYASIGDFFVRRLRGDARPLGGATLVHPADSVITESDWIKDGKIIQAKGRYYSLQDFVGTNESAKPYQGGAFATYYLCPTDYHRVHSPVSGQIVRVRHLPGHLWPVNDWSTTHIENLFAVNERVLVEIQTDFGLMGVMFVGATNVGQISLSFWPEFRSNDPRYPSVRERVFEPSVAVTKGDELGAFHMGSTIVLLFSEEMFATLPALKLQLPHLKGLKARVREDLLQNSKPASVPH